MKYKHLYDTEHIKTNVKRQAIRGATATVTTRVLSYVFQTIGTIILARVLVPEDFGLVAMVTVISNILVEFGMLRLSDAIIQKDTITHDQVSTLFWVNIVLCTIISLIFILSSPLLALFYKEPRIKYIAIVISTSFIFSGLSNQHIALMVRNMLIIKLAFIQIIALILTDIISIIMALQGYGYWSIVMRRIGQPFFMTICAWIGLKWKPGLPVRNSDVIPMIKYGINSLGSYTANHFARSLDKLLIGWKYGALQLGYYERAYFLFVMPVNQITYPLTSVAVATLSRLIDNPERFRNYYYKSIFSLAMIGMPLSAFLTITGRDIIRILLGPKWEMAGIIFTVFAPSVGVMLVYATYTWLHLSIGRADLLIKWSIFSLFVTAMMMLIGVIYGPIYIAAAYSISFYLLFIPGLWYAGRGINIYYSKIISIMWRPFIASLMSGIITWFIVNTINVDYFINVEMNLIIKLLFTMFVFGILYVVATLAVYGSLNPFYELYGLFKENFAKKNDV